MNLPNTVPLRLSLHLQVYQMVTTNHLQTNKSLIKKEFYPHARCCHASYYKHASHTERLPTMQNACILSPRGRLNSRGTARAPQY
jgi:hypothetical protein